MAFNFLGTLTSDQLQEFRSFLDEQIVDIDEQINFLYIEMNNIQQTINDFSDSDSYFGGDAISSLSHTQLPLITDTPQQDDSYPASLMVKVKEPFISTIKYKRERLEYKIKKLLDAWEQTKEMIDKKSAAKTQTVALLNQIESLIIQKNANILTSV
jgi:hypothetical protein